MKRSSHLIFHRFLFLGLSLVLAGMLFAQIEKPVSAGVLPFNCSAPPAGIVCKTGAITFDETWEKSYIYVITGEVTIAKDATVTIEGGSTIKFDTGAKIDTYGSLVVLSSADEKTMFTSIKDDYKGDTNADGSNTLPGPGDWQHLILRYGNSVVQNAIVQYSQRGLWVINNTELDFAPTIQNNTFNQNVYGLYLYPAAGGDIIPVLDGNIFTKNDYGLVTEIYPGVMGASRPALRNCNFNNNRQFPIFLNGGGYPEYQSNNTFSGHPGVNQRLAIGLGGMLNQNGSLPKVNNMPYVIIEDTSIPDGVTVTAPTGLVIKFSPKKTLFLHGALQKQGQVSFTSLYDDDEDGQDTNGDTTDLEPRPGDWNAVILYNDLNPMSGVRVKYSMYGLYYYNSSFSLSSPLALTITANRFESNHFGIYFHATPGNLITGDVSGNLFINNESFPIVMNGTAYPTFNGNTFTGNWSPAIGLTGEWYGTGSWPAVVGDNSTVMPYAVIDDGVVTHVSSNITIPAGMVFKFLPKAVLNDYGVLVLQSTPAEPVVMTSFKDDAYKGDTNHDRQDSVPAMSDWSGFVVKNSATNIHNLVLKYSVYGVYVYNNTAGALNPPITNSVLEANEWGVFLEVNASGDITSNISGVDFNANKYGLGTFLANNTASGTSRPSLNNNTFRNSLKFPIHLGGTAEPVYGTNTFDHNFHRAIALSGFFNANVTLAAVPGEGGRIFPYAVVSDWVITKNAIIPPSTIFKFLPAANIAVFPTGGMELQSSPQAKMVFTSFKDDTYDDTNADGGGTRPAKGDWGNIYLESSNTNFHDAIVKFGTFAVNVYNLGGSPINPSIKNCTFDQNKNAIELTILAGGDITSEISGNTITNSEYGMVTYVDVYGTGGAFIPFYNNSFDNSSLFPLYFAGTTDLTLDANRPNTFSRSAHPAIAVSGRWSKQTTWRKITGDNASIFPYVVIADVVLRPGLTIPTMPRITMPAGLVVKFDLDTSFYVYGILDLQGTTDEVITFTSYRDDSVFGDTNADGAMTVPSDHDWKTIWIVDQPIKNNDIHHIVARYAVAPLGVYYSGGKNSAISTKVRESTFTNSRAGLMLAVGYIEADTGQGDILAELTDIKLKNNWVGLATFSSYNATGRIMPKLTNVRFESDGLYPIFFGGTTYPVYVSGNVIDESVPWKASGGSGASLASVDPLVELSAPEAFAAIPTGGDTPAQSAKIAQWVADQSSSGIVINGVNRPPVGLGGVYNNSGVLPQVAGLTYAIAGGYPIIMSVNGVPEIVNQNLIIGYTNASGTSVSVQAGTLFKIAPALMIDAKGNLDVQGTDSQPVIFTSFKDDSLGGDTNRDGNQTVPQKGDWLGIYLRSSATRFNHSVVKYSSEGLHINFDGAFNTNISPSVSYSLFSENTVGLTLWAVSAGDVMSEISNNTFMNNDTDVLGHATTGQGRLLVNIHNNDILGSTTLGINNQTTYTINALNNYWGHASGPKHTTNPAGQGVAVSNRVNFNPWLAASMNPGITYAIQGRILTPDTVNPSGIKGVLLTLNTGATALTNDTGSFSFTSLTPGTYTVTPTLKGYAFTPSSFTINVPPDASLPIITGVVVTEPLYTVSGSVRDLDNLPVPGVTIQVSGGATVVTNSQGEYVIENLKAGSYTITASKTGQTFTPPSISVNLSENLAGQNFIMNSKLNDKKRLYMPTVFK